MAEKWISMRDRVPATNTTVIVYGSHYIPGGRRIEPDKVVCEAYYMGRDSTDDTPVFAHGTRFMAVDAWMPMPEPPDEARKRESELLKRYGIDGPFGPK